MSDRAPRRLMVALAASVLVHSAVMQAMEGTAARRAQRAPVLPLHVTLPVPRVALSEKVAEPPLETPTRAHPPRSPADDVAPVPQTRAAALAHALLPEPTPAHRDAAPTTPGEAAVTQVSDPTYYGARSLDVFPRALSVLDLGPLATGGKVRATVYIDESGAVNDVRAIQATSQDTEHAARDVLKRTRFTPAYKDGRVVKAQLVVSLE